MSRAGTKSNQGDDYQLKIAIHWLLRLLSDDDIDYIQAESNGLPNMDEKVSVDDVVIVYKDGHRRHIQAKKNQTNHRVWNLSDLKDELPKIRDQLEVNANVVVEFYSRTPFGNLHSLSEASREYLDLAAFRRESGQMLQQTLIDLAKKWGRPENEVFYLLRRLEFGPYHSLNEWDRLNQQEAARLVSNVDLALTAFKEFLNKHQSKLQTTVLTIQRDDILDHLNHVGLALAPMLGEEEILEKFRSTSSIGREWSRTVGGSQIQRPEMDELIQLVASGASSVLVTDRPGSGKTCLLLDIADHIELDARYGLLFIKGDRYIQFKHGGDSQLAGLPEDIIGCCSRLTEYRQVVVIIDSLDVLSLNRKHGVLAFFLNLIDRLNSLSGVTVIAACREFDLQYDPLLRDRTWEHKIHLTDFDYDTVVAPLLNEWGVPESQVSEEMKQLLRLPQNLRLFEAVATRNDYHAIRNTYELFELFLDEVVRKNSDLGHPAIIVLQRLAEQMLHDRTHMIPLSVFTGDELFRQTLVSNGVLYQDSTGNLAFGHQTLFDNMVVYSALARGDELATFIKAHPPFPFLRPAVRTFVFHLRTHAISVFTRQIWSTLVDDNVAYHFKRLIVESLAEMNLQEDDWPLIRRIYQSQPELFRRMFWRLDGDAWFRLLVDYWLPSLRSLSRDGEWYVLFANRLERWMNSHPKEVVALWQRALSKGWDESNNIPWHIVVDLNKFTQWETAGIYDLLQTLQGKVEADRNMIGKVISRYVEATDKGDDLLWRHIISDVDGEDVHDVMSYSHKLHCESHQFHKEQFLHKRLIDSENLLDLVITTLKSWAKRDVNHSTLHGLRSTFMYSSSWERRHSRRDIHHADGLSILLNGVENAFKHHAKLNDSWWLENEPKLRSFPEETIRYFLTKAYMENPELNVAGIAGMLTDKEMLHYGRINYEIGELILAGYHYLNNDEQESHQVLVLGLYDGEDWGEECVPKWATHNIYEYLIWIPAIFRLPETQILIEQYQKQFGISRPEPHIHSWGGMVGSPVSLNNLMELSNSEFFRLLNYYNDYQERSNHPADHLTGGRDMVERTLSDLAAYDPVRYYDLIPELIMQGFQSGYLIHLLRGIAEHLRYRFGRLQPPQGWQAIEPAPDGLFLVRALICLLEKYSELWDDGHAVARILEACCEVVEDIDDTNRIVFLLYRLLKHFNPEEDKQVIFTQGKEEISDNDLRHTAINSVRGIAAGSAIGLCNRLIEQGKDIPELMLPLLRHCARDPVMAVRAALLDHLPYLTYKRYLWGWQLFRDIFREPQIYLWPLAESHLYHQYHECFNDVVPYLNRMRVEAPDEAANSWARIITLASLSGHVDRDELFKQLKSVNTMEVWEGAAQVFVANLNRHSEDGLCIYGLSYLLDLEEQSEQLYRSIGHAFDIKSHSQHIDLTFALKYIDAMKSGGRQHDLYELLDWVADLTGRDPVAALTVCEHLVDKLSDQKSAHQLWRTEPLISALSGILREADETEDETLIRRAVNLQDQFLRMDIRGIEDFFEQAGH